MKENFLLKKSQQEIFNELSDEEAGKLIKGIFNYADTGESGLDGYLKIIFIPIKTEIDKNEENYKKRCEINKTNGSKGGAPKGNKNAKKKKTTENNQSVKKTTENNMNSHNHNHISLSYINNQDQLLNNKLNDIKQIVDYLNLKTNSKFKYFSKTTQTKIIARLNEGYRLDDFIVVIDKKCKEWIGTEFERYLTPDVLFGTKFEKYLNQKITVKKEKENTFLEVLKGVDDGTIILK